MSRRDAMNIYSYEAGSTYEHIFYEEQRDNWSILSRSGHAVAHDEEPPRARHSNVWRKSVSLPKKGRRCGGGALLGRFVRTGGGWRLGMQWRTRRRVHTRLCHAEAPRAPRLARSEGTAALHQPTSHPGVADVRCDVFRLVTWLRPVRHC